MTRQVLGVVRTVTSAVRLLDELEALRGDLRIRVSFWVDETSRFSPGARALLETAGARILDDTELARGTFDLVLTASENASVAGIDAPVLVLPHGAGFHKNLRDIDGTPRISGVSIGRPAGLRDFRLAVAHPVQQTQLARLVPELAERSVLARDSYFDRLRASRSLRPQYREALGIGRRRLIVVSSTWGDQALFTGWPDLPARLLAELPEHDYAVALVLHPNLWSGHGGWQVRTWLADALDAGLLLVPPENGWPATVLAADLVIGDHGSVTFYAACLDRPVLLGGKADSEVVPGTALATLISSADRLAPDRNLRAQIEDALTSDNVLRGAGLGAAAFAAEAEHTVADLVLGALRLEPRVTAQRAWPLPRPNRSPVASFQVITSGRPGETILAERFPAAVAGPEQEVRPDRFQHLVAYDDEIHLGRRESASALISRSARTPAEASAWVREQVRHRLLAASPVTDGSVLLARRGNPATFRVTGPAPELTDLADVADVADLTEAVAYHLIRRSGGEDFVVPQRVWVQFGLQQPVLLEMSPAPGD